MSSLWTRSISLNKGPETDYYSSVTEWPELTSSGRKLWPFPLPHLRPLGKSILSISSVIIVIIIVVCRWHFNHDVYSTDSPICARSCSVRFAQSQSTIWEIPPSPPRFSHHLWLIWWWCTPNSSKNERKKCHNFKSWFHMLSRNDGHIRFVAGSIILRHSLNTHPSITKHLVMPTNWTSPQITTLFHHSPSFHTKRVFSLHSLVLISSGRLQIATLRMFVSQRPANR